MLQESLSDYLFQVAIFTQPFLWMWLLRSRIGLNDRLRYIFYLAGVAFIMAVWVTGFEVGYYNSHLLIQYAANTMLAVYLLNQRKCFKESLCLAFLLVYINSYYWELPLHIVEAAILFPVVRIAVQATHLVAVPFLLGRYELTAAHRDTVWNGFRFSAYSIAAIWFSRVCLGTPVLWKILGYVFVRTVCLLFLVKVYAEAESHI